MPIGAHISIANGIQHAPQRATELGCEVMQIFTRSPQGGKAPELTSEIISAFKENCHKFNISDTYIHAPYYINFASTNNRIRYGSVSVVRDELERGAKIGSKYVMTHLGSAGELTAEEASEKTSQMLKKALESYHGKTQLLLENSAGAGKIIGNSFFDLAKIIKAVNSSAIAGICLDTQHSFASGYNWIQFEETLQRIDEEIGLDKIKLIHCNDSKSELNSHYDRHEHIGAGKIGAEPFRHIVSFAKKHKIDMIIETEHEGVKKDIEILKKLRKYVDSNNIRHPQQHCEFEKSFRLLHR